MLDIEIKTIPHRQQRYTTVGDWFFDSVGHLTIRVSQLDDWRYEFLIAIHELVEAYFCKWTGVSQQDVDRFDMEFEKNRVISNRDEPGDDPRAPYHQAHRTACAVEALLAVFLFVDWFNYTEAVDNL